MREDHLRSAAMHIQHIQHMQKALIEMYIRLPEVLSQLHGVSGMALIRAILSGERDVQKLISLCHASVREKKGEKLRKALQGHYTAQGLFALNQALKAYEFYQRQILDCDGHPAKDQQRQNAPPGAGEGKRKVIRHNKPNIEGLGDHLLKYLMAGMQLNCPALPIITGCNYIQK